MPLSTCTTLARKMAKIYPRSLEISDGTETCSFRITNSSKDDRILLFKIRRSEPKLLEFQPKSGIVEPGVTRHVVMQLINPNVTYARVLIKMVVLRRANIQSNFQDSWNIGAQKGGVVKKVVDVKNKAFF